MFSYTVNQWTTVIPRFQYYSRWQWNYCHIHDSLTFSYICDHNLCNLIMLNVSFVNDTITQSTNSKINNFNINFNENNDYNVNTNNNNNNLNLLNNKVFESERTMDSPFDKITENLINEHTPLNNYDTIPNNEDYFLKTKLKSWKLNQNQDETKCTNFGNWDAFVDSMFYQVVIPVDGDPKSKEEDYKINSIHQCFYDPNDREKKKIVFASPTELWFNFFLSLGLLIVFIAYLLGVPLFIIRKTTNWETGEGYGRRIINKARSFMGIYSNNRYIEH